MYSYRSLLSLKLKTFLRLENFQKSRTKKRPLLLARSVVKVDRLQQAIYRHSRIIGCRKNPIRSAYFDNGVHEHVAWALLCFVLVYYRSILPIPFIVTRVTQSLYNLYAKLWHNIGTVVVSVEQHLGMQGWTNQMISTRTIIWPQVNSNACILHWTYRLLSARLQ